MKSLESKKGAKAVRRRKKKERIRKEESQIAIGFTSSLVFTLCMFMAKQP